MSYYLSIYLFSIVLSLCGWWMVWRRHRNTSGLFFLLFTVIASAWFFFYFLFFSGIQEPGMLLVFSRICFWLAIAGVYSLLFFIYFFDSRPGRIDLKWFFAVLSSYALLGAIYVFTDAIVASLSYSAAEGTYREVLGGLYPMHLVLHAVFVILFVWIAVRQVRRQTLLNRMRLKRVLFSAFLLAFSLIILQVVLPLWGIWVLEKEIVFLFLFFVLSVVFVVKRYYFSALGYRIGHLVVTVSSIGFSIGLLNIIKGAYLRMGSNMESYWIVQDGYSIIDTTLGVVLFLVVYKLLRKTFLWETARLELKNKVRKLERGVSYLTRVDDVEKYLKTEMKQIFRASFTELRMFSGSEGKTEMQQYFESHLSDGIFINDIVFMEEKKNRFHKERFLSELPEEAFLVLPIFDTDGNANIGVFIVGVKSFGDFYSTDEIRVLKDFVSFLELHLKYIKTYQLLQDISVNLDKKVDEKTMEFNNLINRQKEFISVISHEIKSPIANAIFQADSILDDLANGSLSSEDMQEEVRLLNEELLKTGELTTKLFSAQYFDTRSVTLFRERVQIATLLGAECEVYARMHEGVRFVNEVSDSIEFVEIDKIQFQQVITNLLQNAVKFLDKKDSVIVVGADKDDSKLSISIEDNGRGFQWIDAERLFDRYFTGNGESVGLGMGLYLCKKIVEMHGGTIVASIGERLWWAKFNIEIPLD